MHTTTLAQLSYIPAYDTEMLGFYQPISSWSHLLAGIIALCTGYILIRKGWGNTYRVVSLFIFLASAVFLFMMSGTYHALEPGFGRQVFRRLDYAAIYTVIAGTATPIHMILFRGRWRWAMLSFIWTFAIVGLILTIILLDNMPEWLTLAIFISMGWSAILSIFHAWKLYGFKHVALAFYGGLAYTIGAAIDFLRIPGPLEGLVGHHEVFHLFVILGAALHWKLIYNWADQPTHSKLIFMVREKADNCLIAKAVGENIRISATSREELRKLVKEYLKDQFHPGVVPAKVRFRFYRDAVVEMKVSRQAISPTLNPIPRTLPLN